MTEKSFNSNNNDGRYLARIKVKKKNHKWYRGKYRISKKAKDLDDHTTGLHI